MSWIKLDDQFADHPKVIAAGPLASWMYVCGLTYAGRYLTDGFIPAGQVRKLADVDNATELAARLVEVGLWEPTEDGYLIHDYHDYNPRADKVRAERAANAKRQAEWRDRNRQPDGSFPSDETASNAVSSDVTCAPLTPAPSPSPSPSPCTTAAACARANGLEQALTEHGIIINGPMQSQMWSELYQTAGPDLFRLALDEAARASPRVPTVKFVDAIIKRCLAEGIMPGQRTQTVGHASRERQPPARASPPSRTISEAPRTFRNPISGEVETV